MTALQKQMHSLHGLGKLPRSYLVVHPQREERRKLLERICQEILLSNPGSGVHFWESDEVTWTSIRESLVTPSLFGGIEVFVWDGVKGLSETVLESIVSYVLSPSSQVFFLIGADSLKAVSDLYQKTKEVLPFLDFSAEKPWDRQKRVEQETLQTIQKSGKRIAPNALHRFLLSVGSESLGLEGELSKLLTYVGTRSEIVEQDVLAISSSLETATGWQLAEGLVWGQAVCFPSSQTDLSFLLGLLGQVRFYLLQGRQVGWYLQQKTQVDDISAAMPSLRPAQLKKITEGLFSKDFAYFDAALSVVYEVELFAKNSNLSAKFLFDLLQTKITQAKQIYTR